MFDKGQKQSSTLSCDSSYLMPRLNYEVLEIRHLIKILKICFLQGAKQDVEPLGRVLRL